MPKAKFPFLENERSEVEQARREQLNDFNTLVAEKRIDQAGHPSDKVIVKSWRALHVMKSKMEDTIRNTSKWSTLKMPDLPDAVMDAHPELVSLKSKLKERKARMEGLVEDLKSQWQELNRVVVIQQLHFDEGPDAALHVYSRKSYTHLPAEDQKLIKEFAKTATTKRKASEMEPEKESESAAVVALQKQVDFLQGLMTNRGGAGGGAGGGGKGGAGKGAMNKSTAAGNKPFGSGGAKKGNGE